MELRPAQTSYDEVPYPGMAYPQTHPDRLATIATLLGMQPAPVTRCRVLELGCADGGNLLPMALALPGSTFVGIDLSARQIADGQALAAELGLSNLRLLHLNILEVAPDLGEFDYIIAHGIYSWVPAEVRDALLAICRQNLAPHGIAYVSYNVFPGWHLFAPLRALLRHHTAGVRDADERLRRARALIELLTDKIGAENSETPLLMVAAANLSERLKTISAEGQSSILLHDLMEEVNHPVYFSEFAEHVARHRLMYVAEANFPLVMPRGLPDSVLSWIRGAAGSGVDVEQYMDFFRSRTFRQSLVTHAGATIDRSLHPKRIPQFAIMSQATPADQTVDLASGVVARFSSGDGATLAIDTPISKAALLELCEVWPRALPFSQLLDAAIARLAALGHIVDDRELAAQALAADLLTGYCYSLHLVNFSLHPAPIPERLSEHPVVMPLTRFQARMGRVVTTLHHENADPYPLARHLLTLLDGSCVRDDLVQAAEAFCRDHPDPEAAPEAVVEVDRFLRWAYSVGMLIG